MIWKLLILTGIFAGTLWVLGYRPDDLQRSASALSRGNASAISPTGNDGSDWGK